MADFSLFRFFRFIRSILAPLTTVLAFSLLLTWIFILYQPTEGPGAIQRLGWQAWDTVTAPRTQTNTNTGSGTPTESEPGDSSTSPPSPPSHGGVDWWNVTTEDKQPDSSTLPLDIWNPLLPHDTGLTEITIARCIYPPGFDSMCFPKSTPESDAIKGKWVRVEHDLNKRNGLWSLYIYYRRTRRLDVDLIKDILLVPEGQQPSVPGNWHKVPTSIRDGVPRAKPVYLWYDLGKTASFLTQQEKNNLITELDVHFGDDRPWFGFEKLEPATTLPQEGRVESAWLTVRRGVKATPHAPPLHFSRDGKFKILQIADLHFSVSHGKCRDVSFSPCERADDLTKTLVEHVLDEEKPDMVVFTGDQLNGQTTSWDAKSVLAKFATAVTDRAIPWAAVFGNHDDEEDLSREEQMTLMQAMPYSLVSPGPKDIHGVGNYVLKVYSPDPSKTQLLTLYFLDSGGYSKGVLDFLGFFHPTEYDWIRQSQTDWFLQESAQISAIERPFTPDGTSDFGDIWTRQSGNQVTPDQKKLAKPNALMFFHIPLRESYSPPDVDPNTGLPLDTGVHGIEEPGNAKNSDGFFEKGVLEAFETDHSAGGNVREVKVIANGHCHITEDCRRVKGVWLCFGGGGSFSGYGKVGFDRRFRVYEISDFGETIKTYKRTERDEIVDEMILAGKGAPPPYEGP